MNCRFKEAHRRRMQSTLLKYLPSLGKFATTVVNKARRQLMDMGLHGIVSRFAQRSPEEDRDYQLAMSLQQEAEEIDAF